MGRALPKTETIVIDTQNGRTPEFAPIAALRIGGVHAATMGFPV